MLKLALAATLALAAGGAAFAEAPMTASLQTAVAKPAEVLAGSTLWACSDKLCTVKTVSVDSDSWLECRKLVQNVGRVATYGSLDENKLALCNAGAKK